MIRFGAHVFYYSYLTLVAYKGPLGNARVSAVSRTTSKHLSQMKVDDLPIMDEEVFRKFVSQSLTDDLEP